MKKAVVFLITIMILTVACNQEQPVNLNSKEKVLSITHRFYKGECLGYCDTWLIIDSNRINYIQDGWTIDSLGEFRYLPRIDSNFSITNQKWNSIISLINMKKFMQLDSAYMHDDLGTGVSEGYFELEIKTNQNTKKIKFFVNKYLDGVDSLNKALINLRFQI